MRDEQSGRGLEIPPITVNVNMRSFDGEISHQDQAILDRLLRQSERLVKRLERLDRSMPERAT